MIRSFVLAVGLLAMACTGGKSDPVEDVDATPRSDADPSCQGLDSLGGFPDCSRCDALGSGCDTIDVNGQISRVCDCTSACPCGLRCGDVEIAPGVVVGNVCIR